MAKFKKGMKLQNLKSEEVIAEVTSVIKDKGVELDVNGEKQVLTMEEVEAGWQVYIVDEPKQEDAPKEDELYVALEKIYNALTGHCAKMEGVEYKVNSNGTTACKLTGKGNFAEIRLQKKRLIMRVLHTMDKKTGFELKEIPESYGWIYKTEVNIKPTDDVKKLIAELDASRTEKAK